MNDRLLHGLDSSPPAARGGVLTIGNFDGVHLGHRRILSTARTLADAQKLPVIALTFEPPPDRVVRPGDVPKRLTPPEEKGRLLLEAGADWVVFARSDRALFEMSAQEFIRDVLVAKFAPRHLVEGPNFLFGRGRAGTIDTLRSAGETAGFLVHVADPVLRDLPEGAQRISSTLIRHLVSSGRIEDARACLGQPFALYGRVIAGEGRGRLLDFPTSNIVGGEQVCPSDGIYAAAASVAGRDFASAVSIGNKPTFGPSERAIEAHLIGASGDFYHEHLTLRFLRRLRDQVRFDGPEQLKRQIAKDVQNAQEIYKQWRASGQ